MKNTETKLAYIKARAEGKSYDTIATELGIAKGTCSNWERELRADIDAMKRVQAEELYTAYNMKRDARIRTLGEIIKSLDTAIADISLEDIPPEKLLELRLKYGRELKTEYIEPIEIETDNTLDGLLEQYNQLYRDSKTGKYSPADIKAQLSILDAKRATLIQAEGEHQKEEGDPFSLEYKSGLLRREA